MASSEQAEADILSLFEAVGVVETPTPGVKAWLARDTAAPGQQPVLIKRISATATGKGRATEALALRHPAIVRTRRWLAQEDGTLYVVRDVVRGKNLRQVLGRNPDERTAAAIEQMLLPIIEALTYAHARGYAHGGISAENILIAEGGAAAVAVSDWATVDPKASQHFLHYNGAASVGGDVKALSRLAVDFLPTTGAFASAAMRERIAGIFGRCETLAAVKETVTALERLAAAPMPRSSSSSSSGGGGGGGGAPQTSSPAAARPAPLDLGLDDAPKSDAPAGNGTPRLTCTLAEKSARVVQGGGGTATLIVKSEGDAPLLVRMIATQHPWLNVRPRDLPLTIPPGGQESVAFAISAARLTPGEYRSEVYLSANAPGKAAEDLRGGWFRHTAEIRITVEGGAALRDTGYAGASKPPFPANAPRVPSGSGCLLILPAMLAAWLRSGGGGSTGG